MGKAEGPNLWAHLLHRPLDEAGACEWFLLDKSVLWTSIPQPHELIKGSKGAKVAFLVIFLMPSHTAWARSDLVSWAASNSPRLRCGFLPNPVAPDTNAGGCVHQPQLLAARCDWSDFVGTPRNWSAPRRVGGKKRQQWSEIFCW